MLKSLIAISGLLVFSPVVWGVAVKHDSVAAKGCNAMASMSQAESAMRRFNLTTENAKDEEIRALGTGLIWIEALNGGKPLKLATWAGSRPYPFVFKNARGSRQLGGSIEIGRKTMPYGFNVAQLVHELGHLVGNQGGYAQYRKAVKGYCVVSGYSDDKFNEQFAEVFAAFVTKPELIAESKSAACRAAFKFFKDTMFDKGERVTTCKNNDGILDQ